MTIKDVRGVLEQLNKHNEEQRVITRMNEPLLKQCREMVDKINGNGITDGKVNEIIEHLNAYLTSGTGLKEVKAEVEEYLILTTKQKMEELESYKY